MYGTEVHFIHILVQIHNDSVTIVDNLKLEQIEKERY